MFIVFGRVGLILLMASPAQGAESRSAHAEGQRSEPAGVRDSAWSTLFRYGQSANPLATVQEIKSGEKNLQAIDAALRKRYGKPEEALALVRVEWKNADGIYVEGGSEAIAYGLVQDPVVPELEGRALVMPMLGVGARAERWRLGLFGGAGMQKAVKAVSTDLIDRIPVRKSRVQAMGVEGSANFPLALASHVEAELRPSLRVAHYVLENDSESMTVSRWKAFGLVRETQSRLSVHAIAGMQPLPSELLPRTWDYMHALPLTSELGTMMGAGVEWHALRGETLGFKVSGGFYAGYPGGSVEVQYGALSLALLSYGLEASSAYQVLGYRLNALALSARF